MANMSSIVEPVSTGGINLTMPTMETSIIAAAVGAKRRKQTKVTQIQVITYFDIRLTGFLGVYSR